MAMFDRERQLREKKIFSRRGAEDAEEIRIKFLIFSLRLCVK